MIFEFKTPYTLVDHEYLGDAQAQAVNNISTTSDLSGLDRVEREVSGNVIRYELAGVAESDLSSETRQAIITAFEDNLPGASQFEVVDPDP